MLAWPRAGVLNLSVTDVLGWIIPGCEAFLRIAGLLAAPQVSTHWSPVAIPRMEQQKCFQILLNDHLGTKVPLVENHRTGVISRQLKRGR